jgi:hypothetical protein
LNALTQNILGHLQSQYKKYPHSIKTSKEVPKRADFNKISFRLPLSSALVRSLQEAQKLQQKILGRNA